MHGYAICTAPRSGSNYLGQLLESTGVLGRPREYFNAQGRRNVDDPAFPDDPREQIQRVLSDGATENGIYAVKAFPYQLQPITAAVRLTEALPNLHFVRLARRDLLGQAISWARALQTLQYRSTQAIQYKPTYDGNLILNQLAEIARASAAWDVYFARTGQSALSLTYEDIEAEPEDAVDQIGQMMGIGAAKPNPEAITLEIQRDPLNEAWRERFVREFGDPNILHTF